MYNEIINPSNNKKYSIFSKQGLKTIKKYINSSKKLPIHKLVGVNSHPFVLYYFKNIKNYETNQKISSILFIGEEHEFSKYKCKKHEKDCYNINEFQKAIFKYIDEMGCKLDVFIENYTKNINTTIGANDIYESFVKTEKSMLNSWKNRFIMKSENDFNNLLKKNIKGESISKYNNVFFHLVDLRYMFNGKLNVFVAIKLLEMDINDMFPWFNFTKTNIQSILIYLLCKKTIKTKNEFNKGEKIIKKMGKTIDVNIGNKIKTYSFMNFIILYKKLISMIIANFKNDQKFIYDYIKSVITITFVFGPNFLFDTLDSLLMDIYNINKMFKIPRKNIVFYGGGWHCMLYCEFIKQHYKMSPTINSKNKIFEELILENFNYECGI